MLYQNTALYFLCNYNQTLYTQKLFLTLWIPKTEMTGHRIFKYAPTISKYEHEDIFSLRNSTTITISVYANNAIFL